MTLALRTVKRETLSSIRERGRSRPIIIEIRPTFVVVRLKGRRSRFTATIEQIFTLACRNAAEQVRKDRAAARKARKERTA